MVPKLAIWKSIEWLKYPWIFGEMASVWCVVVVWHWDLQGYCQFCIFFFFSLILTVQPIFYWSFSLLYCCALCSTFWGPLWALILCWVEFVPSWYICIRGDFSPLLIYISIMFIKIFETFLQLCHFWIFFFFFYHF